MLSAEASSAICVQRFDGSRNSAIHTTYRISLRSSSLREPRYPLLRVVLVKMRRLGLPHLIRFKKGFGLVLMVWFVKASATPQGLLGLEGEPSLRAPTTRERTPAARPGN